MSKFTIEVEMDDHWIPCFLSMLKEMEANGKAGRSRPIAFYADGDGTFRPTFKFSIPFEQVSKVKLNMPYAAKFLTEIYDAG